MKAAGVYAVAALAGAVLAPAQLWLASALGILVVPDPGDSSGDRWPFEQLLLAWYPATAVALGVVAACWLAGRLSWPVRPGLTVPAVVGGLASVPLVRWWAAQERSRTDPVCTSTRAVLLGLAVGAAAALLAEAWPAVRRGLVAWVCWVWCAVGASLLIWVAGPPLGLLVLPERSGFSEYGQLLLPVALCGVLGYRAARRGERVPVLGAVAGPLLLSGCSAVLLPFTGASGDHYIPGTEFWVWLVVAVLGSAAAALTALLGRYRRTLRQPADA
jgi:hypothetical protein